MRYLDTLLLYFEEEIMGEAYFLALADAFNEPVQKHKMTLLAKVERQAAEIVRPLLDKYELRPRTDEVLHEIGLDDVAKTKNMGWQGMITHMVNNYPDYMPQFEVLETMAPIEDRPLLEILTEHETATIEFAKLELSGDPESTVLLETYIKNCKEIRGLT
ncbi:MAG: hypothetical protein AAF423_10495 [Pseudomonadota bacterium]